MEIMTLFLISFVSALDSACLTSSEEYAVEVVIPEYNLDKIKGIATMRDNKYLSPSQYNEQFISMYYETRNPKGLSVRLQTPTELKEIIHPRVKLASTSVHSIDIEPVRFFAGWESSCTGSQCLFVKEDLKFQAYTEINEASIEINRELPVCDASCTGTCFNSISEVKCIDSETQRELESILKYTKVAEDLDEFLQGYRISGTEEIIILDIIPSTNPYIDWREAMKQELVFLDNAGAISLDKEDIEEISVLSKLGRAGQNYRIVKNESAQHDWLYYGRTPNAVLSSQDDCKAYILTKPAIQIGDITGNLFYSIPLIIILSGAGLLAVIICIAVVRQKLGERFKN